MLLKRSSLAFLLYLASVVSTTPIEAPVTTPVDAVLVGRDGPGANRTEIAHPIVLLTIVERAQILATGAAAITAATAVAAYISTRIKQQSDNHSCGVISGNIDHVNYQYSATGRNCDTTSQQKTVDDALNRAIAFMNGKNVNQACFLLTHGGTWKGYLQLAANGRQIIGGKCASVSYPITI
ncbi:MAG: hypothetical protein LQ350_004163 [Teloschistes chrysophthalmus]|nr:MAG: hypothetical protein LQ350_004163 [Niorma chrysophthalma]